MNSNEIVIDETTQLNISIYNFIIFYTPIFYLSIALSSYKMYRGPQFATNVIIGGRGRWYKGDFFGGSNDQFYGCCLRHKTEQVDCNRPH